MGLWRATKTCIRKAFVLSGRASRSEFWWWLVGATLIALLAGLCDVLAFGIETTFAPISALVAIALTFPSFTVAWRRLHDTDKPGGLNFLPLATFPAGIAVGAICGERLGQVGPILAGLTMLSGPVLVCIWMLLPSQAGSNTYGPNPNEVTS